MKNKNIIVTGASSGIGKAIAKKFLENDATVINLDVSPSKFEHENLKSYQIDLSDIRASQEVIEKIQQDFGSIDVLVNNAGVNLPALLVDPKEEVEVTEELMDWFYKINQKSIVFLTQAVVRNMISYQKKGVIVNVSSESGKEGSLGQSLYTGTKAALNSYTRSWAKELGPYGIRVIGIEPGINEPTGLTNSIYNERLAKARNTTVDALTPNYSKSIPLGRPGKLEEIANVVVFAASDKASYITGTNINVSGGKSRG